MSLYFHLRAVPPPALRNSATWFRRLFADDWTTVRERIGRHREEVLDKGYLHHAVLYAGGPPHRAPDGPRAHVVLGGRPVSAPEPELPPFLVLTAAQAHRVAEYLAEADFERLWRQSREELLRPYGVPEAEREIRGAFASAHRDLTAFYARTAQCGDAVVKWLLVPDAIPPDPDAIPSDLDASPSAPGPSPSDPAAGPP
ncbi:DUF1877 family protein [Streptomyces sp. NPDC052415]|uniref:DUF1877 family protein n=1 Tax=Streptomyces sp. NPDC052415 TaxID=3365690 RepID=UPI0037D579C2